MRLRRGRRIAGVSPRFALTATLLLIVAQMALTTRWAATPSSLNGARRPWVLASLVLTSICLASARRLPRLTPSTSQRIALLGAWLGAIGLLLFGCLTWFPPHAWTSVPITNNWAARYQSTIDGVHLLSRAAICGWQWDFLGGYPTCNDFTVRLSLLAWAPVSVFGNRVGFHILHVLLFLAIPFAVYVDFRVEDRRVLAPFAGACSAVGAAGLSYWFLQNGDRFPGPWPRRRGC